MKNICKFSVVFLITIMAITSAQSQKMWGFLQDKEGNDIVGENLDIRVQICKNGDSLFTKTERVMTQSFGAFEVDLTEEFKMSDITNTDKISYSLMFEYDGESITTPKKEWTVALKSTDSDHAAEADHASTSTNALTADHAMVADQATTANTSAMADFANTANTANTAMVATTSLAYQAVDVALPNPGDVGILLGSNTNGTIGFQNIDILNTGPGINILQSDGQEFSFVHVQEPTTNTGELLVWKNINNESLLEPIPLPIEEDFYVLNKSDNESHTWQPIRESKRNWWSDPVPEGNYYVGVDGSGDYSLTQDQIHNLLTNALIGINNVQLINDGVGDPVFGLSPPPFLDDNGTLTANEPITVLNPNTGNNFLNIVPNPNYSAMGNAAFCAAGFFPNKNPLLHGLETEKSATTLEKHNRLWAKDNKRNTLNFIGNVKSIYPEIVLNTALENSEGSVVHADLIDMSALVPLLSKALKEQSDILESQQKQIDELKLMIEFFIANSKK